MSTVAVNIVCCSVLQSKTLQFPSQTVMVLTFDGTPVKMLPSLLRNGGEELGAITLSMVLSMMKSG